jgi:hypothetical protein
MESIWGGILPELFINNYLTVILGKDMYAFYINVFREFIAVFDHEYYTFLRVHSL